ncbi:hypothetical protein GCM10007103_28850 [Salinimicrobium marinum]|uniref:Peptidase E n=1 Tax=Salinimicrobium marinum TaxID=680283 RepID=A0A918SJD9_9FLAO|nr:DUF6702 family protein [Salinimicrobium marinum]GHA46025.1 hypothetical protein GCM10007103_28850 [Salinimicrobium marinum]
MKKTILLLIFLLPLISFTEAHKFYLSVTDMEYSEKNKSLQIISRVFTDDMENLLKTRYSKGLYLTKEEEHEAADGFLKKYLSEKLEIQVNGEQRKFNYLGKKYDNDQLVLFLEVEDLPDLTNVIVRNEVLTDLFPDQKNVVHVSFKGVTKSLLLSRSNESGRINFRN